MKETVGSLEIEIVPDGDRFLLKIFKYGGLYREYVLDTKKDAVLLAQVAVALETKIISFQRRS